MSEIVLLTLALMIGFVLGIFFFGGLWLTVRMVMHSKWPATVFLVSMFLRSSMAVTGFYLVGNGHWQRIILCMIGFISARLFIKRIVKTAKLPIPKIKEEAIHAT